MDGKTKSESFSATLFFIATQKYINYFLRLLPEIETYVNCGEKVQIILLTDSDDQVKCESARIEIDQFWIEHKKWPIITLERYKNIVKFKEKIKSSIFVWCDADMAVESELNITALLNGENLKMSPHPGFTFNTRRLIRNMLQLEFGSSIRILRTLFYLYTGRNGWETNPLSTAFVPWYKRRRYYQGGFWLGKTDSVISMCQELDRHIEKDLEKKIIAVWNDESHLNWYASHHKVSHTKSGMVGEARYPWLSQEVRVINCLDKVELDG
jgi:hypothetical protein